MRFVGQDHNNIATALNVSVSSVRSYQIRQNNKGSATFSFCAKRSSVHTKRVLFKLHLAETVIICYNKRISVLGQTEERMVFCRCCFL